MVKDIESKFLEIVCPRCKSRQTVFGKAVTSIKCDNCNKLLARTTGGKTKIKAPVRKVWMADLKESDIIICIVKKIEGTTVFLDVEGGKQGTMVLSEVSAGRIRNLREFVSPGRRIVCKVLKLHPDRIEMSLRRVTAKEREQAMEKDKQERTLRNVLKAVAKNPDEIVDRIKAENDLLEFIEQAEENPKILQKFLSVEDAEKVAKILFEKEQKVKEVLKKFVLRSDSDSGVRDIKEILLIQDAEIHYLGSSVFSLTVRAKDFKEANLKIGSILEEIKERAKKKKTFFELK